MSVKELQALTQKFADAFDQRDLQPILDMLSEDVEVFDHFPTGSWQGALCQVSQRGHREPCLSQLWLSATIVSHVQR
jgi:hypothetical protein